MRTDRFRPGQRAAFNTILRRIALREPRTAIVLPTRYGKSDLMRLVAYEACERGHSHGSIALSPGIYLRDQLVREEKVRAMSARYDLPPLQSRVRRMEVVTEYQPFSNGEVLLSSTIQLATRGMDDLAETCRFYAGKPIIVHIDECQETSEQKKRGELVDRLIDAGALVVLYTATPIRADGEVIPGFKVSDLRSDDVRRYVATPINDALVRVDVYEGVQRVVELVADHTTTFQDAWQEKPSPICSISREVVDVELRDIGEDEPTKLSEVSDSKARKLISKAARNPTVIDRAVRLFCDELQRRKLVNDQAAGIIFTANDDGSSSNAHAKEIQSVIREVCPALETVIVTMKNEEGDSKSSEMITRFVGDEDGGKPGKGDVLIVKQMGGAGLDAPRIKVLLDLSPVRTVSSVIQRLMRVATPWGATRTASVITLADPLMSGIWHKFVVSQGGESVFSGTCNDLDLVHSYEKERDAGPGPVAVVISGADLSLFDDQSGRAGDLASHDFVNELCARVPYLLDIYTKADLSNRLSGMDRGKIEPKVDQPRSVDAQIESKRNDINERCKGRASAEANYVTAYEAWQDAARRWMRDAKRAAGVSDNVKLKEITNLRTLDAILNFLTP